MPVGQPGGRQREYGTSELSDNALHPVFAAGRVFSMRALDSLLTHAFLEPSIVDLVKHLALPAAEHVFAARKKAPPHAPAADARALRQQSVLATLPVPAAYVGEPFGKLFEHALAAHGVLCVALVSHGADGAGSLLPYVITSPPLRRALLKRDVVYVLTPADGEDLED
jgi:hypothetical protein